MIRSLWTASTGMSSQQLNMDVIAHNLANANTTGYKRSRANFQDLMYQTVVAPGAQTSNDTQIPSGMQIGMGSKSVSVEKLFSQGEFSQTDNPLDLAIEGKGFFKILNGSDEVYSRAGAFKLDKDGVICDAEGNRMQPEVSIPKEAVSVTIDPGGSLSVTDQTGKVLATHQMKLYSFQNPAGLLSVGRNYFKTTDASGDEQEGTPGVDGYGTLLSGFLENSNINVVEEMVNMIIGQRAYEANSKIIKTSDEMLQIANNVVR
jgi:flagellar basal-body rod protein FlgG